MKLYELIYENEIISSEAEGSLQIDHLTADTTKISDNTLLFIINERNAIELKDSPLKPCAVVCNEIEDIPSTIPCIRVKNVRAVMAFAFSRFSKIDYSSMIFIGITGTNGKTSTASFIRKALTESGIKVGFIGTSVIECGNIQITDDFYSMTTPDPWILYPAIKQMQDDGCGAVVMEVSSHALVLDKTAPIVFDYALFTNMSEEHLDFHKNMDDYFASKQKLFSNCKKAVFNIDNAYVRRAARECSTEKITVGILWRGNVWATHISNRGFEGIDYMYRTESFLFKMNLSLPGTHNIYNSMMAAAVCIDMGIAPCMVKKCFSNIKCISGRFEIIKSDITVIIDYAHTSKAFEFFVKEIRAAKLPSEKLCVVFGCGGERDREKRPKMASAAESHADRVIVTSDNPRKEAIENIFDDIKSGFKKSNHAFIASRPEAIRHAILTSESGDIVAIIGKGAERYYIDDSGHHSYDERKIINEALSERSALKI